MILPFDSPVHDDNGTACSGFPVSARPQALPFRGSQSRHLTTLNLPSRHSHPVRHTIPGSYPAAGQAVRVQGHDFSEHMLRRKTPNGTIATGYDGSALQNSTLPPASKQIVLTSPTVLVEPSSKKNELVQSLHPDLGAQTFDWYQRSLDGAQRTQPLRLIAGREVEDGKRLPPLIGGSPTILDRFSTNQDAAFLTHHANGIQTSMVLQPPYQPCVEPTAFNNNGFCGAYWPEGTYEPLLAASTKDLGYGDMSQSDSPYVGYPSVLNNQSDIYQLNGAHAHGDFSFNHSQLFNQLLSVNSRSDTSHTEKHMYAHEATIKGNNITNVSFSPQLLYTPTLYPSGKQQNAQFKEKVLSWAHRVYVDLLAVLRDSKKGPYQSRRVHSFSQTYPHTILYPKVPGKSTAISIGDGSANKPNQLENKYSYLSGYSLNNVCSTLEGRRDSHIVANQLEQPSLVGGSGLRRRPYNADSHRRTVSQESRKVST